MLTAFRRGPDEGYELRLVETEGAPASGNIEVRLPLQRAKATDLLGNTLGGADLKDGGLKFAAGPWKILTFRLD